MRNEQTTVSSSASKVTAQYKNELALCSWAVLLEETNLLQTAVATILRPHYNPATGQAGATGAMVGSNLKWFLQAKRLKNEK